MAALGGASPLETYPVVAVGGSAGAIGALCTLLQGVPRDFPAAICVSIHVPANYAGSALPSILTRATGRPASHVTSPLEVVPGSIFVAPPDFHLVVEAGYARPDHGPRVNRQRPSVDVMFRSLARAYGRRAAAIVLSGNLDDGTAGSAAIRAARGLVVVQDPADAPFPSMPKSAIRHVATDIVAAARDLGPKLTMALEERMNVWRQEPEPLDRPPAEVGEQSAVGQIRCPECSGPLQEEERDGVTTYACHVGHSFAPEVLAAAQSDQVESALWSAVSVVEEQAALTGRLAARAREQQRWLSAARFEERAREASRQAALIRQLLEHPRERPAEARGAGDVPA
ncbi:MAG: chemotaxis protein CheB [Dehalococcoidia bacterium]|nr:chemotaxis protein CheB [Dehalococcoidia bacterium]